MASILDNAGIDNFKRMIQNYVYVLKCNLTFFAMQSYFHFAQTNCL